MNSISFGQVVKTTLTLVFLITNLLPVALAQQNLAAEMRQNAMECRAAGSECLAVCLVPWRELERGREVPDTDIEACRNAHDQLESQATSEPVWTPEYASIPDVVGVFSGALVNADGRDDWKRYCGSAAIVGDGAPWDIPRGATVRVSGVRYVTNPIRSFDRSKNACRANSVEVISTP